LARIANKRIEQTPQATIVPKRLSAAHAQHVGQSKGDETEVSHDRPATGRHFGVMAPTAATVAALVLAGGFAAAFIVWFVLTSLSGLGGQSPLADVASPLFLAVGFAATLTMLAASWFLVFLGVRRQVLTPRLARWRDAAFVALVTCTAWLGGLWLAAYGAYRHYVALTDRSVSISMGTVFFGDAITWGSVLAVVGLAASLGAILLARHRQEHERA
jgi:hypothetical protein